MKKKMLAALIGGLLGATLITISVLACAPKDQDSKAPQQVQNHAETEQPDGLQEEDRTDAETGEQTEEQSVEQLIQDHAIYSFVQK